MSLRDENRRRRDEAVLDAAEALFRERGVVATRLADIARAARVGEATLYNHFASRRALLAAWTRRRVGAALGEAMEEAPSVGARARARAWASHLARRIEADRPWIADAWQPGPVAAAPGLPATPAELRVRAFFEAARERGDIRPDVPCEQLAGLLVAALEHSAAAWLSAAALPAEPLDAYLVRAMELILDGSRRRHGHRRVAATARAVTPR